MSKDYTDLFLRPARQKIAELIKRDTFKSIAAITKHDVLIDMGTSAVKVNTYGKVTWEDWPKT